DVVLGFEVPVDARPGQLRSLGHGGEAQRLVAALQQQVACRVDECGTLPKPVFGKGGGTYLGHLTIVFGGAAEGAGPVAGADSYPAPSAGSWRACAQCGRTGLPGRLGRAVPD